MDSLKKITTTASLASPQNANRSQSIQVNSLTDTDLYRIKVFEIVRRVAVLGNRTVTNTELKEIRDVWMETLIEVIPLDKIVPAFKRAVADKDNSFAPTAFDVIASYKKLAQEAFEQARNTSRCAVGHTTEPPTIQVVNPYDPTGDEVVFPCPYCLPEEYRQERNAFIGQHGYKPSGMALLEAGTMSGLGGADG